MRFSTVKTIYEAALKNKNVFFLTADLGHFGEKDFREKLKKQYLNVGIAEQNMIGIAAGLALVGKKVFVYSIAPFATLRCLEQIKNDVCYQNLDITIIGIGGGFAYGKYGNTHCSIEDIGAMRILPNMKVVCPANPLESEQLLKQIIEIGGPAYFRIGRGKEPVPPKPYRVKFSKGQTIKEGKDITIFTTGTILDEALETARLLEKKSISTEVINIHTIKPIDDKIINKAVSVKKAVFTIEEHNIIGGLGSAISEIIAENSKKNCIFKRFGIRDQYLKEIGDEFYLRDKHVISARTVSKSIISLLK